MNFRFFLMAAIAFAGVGCGDSGGAGAGGGDGEGGSEEGGSHEGGADEGGAGGTHEGGANEGGASSSSIQVQPVETGTTNDLRTVTVTTGAAFLGGEGRTLLQIGLGEPLDMAIGLPDSDTLVVTSIVQANGFLYAATIDSEQNQYADVLRLEKGWIPVFEGLPSCLNDASLATQGDTLIGTCWYYPWSVRVDAEGATETFIPAGYRVFAFDGRTFLANVNAILEVDEAFETIAEWSVEGVTGMVEDHRGDLLAYGEAGVSRLLGDGNVEDVEVPAGALRDATTLGGQATLLVGDDGLLLAAVGDGGFEAVELDTTAPLTAIASSEDGATAIAVGGGGLALELTLATQE